MRFLCNITANTSTVIIVIICSFSCLCLHPITASSSRLEGPNVCQKEEEFNVTTLVNQPIPFTVKTFIWCARIPPRCPSTRTAYKTNWRNETKVTKKTIRICCEGYAQVEGQCLAQVHHYHIVNGTSPSVGLQSETLLRNEDLSSSTIGIWAGICLTLLLVIAFFMLILFKYKKQLHQVKEELNYVTYTSDRGSVSTAHSSSPVYAQVNAHDASIPNNAVKHFVVNDLKSGQHCKESNIERAAVLKKEAALDSDFTILPPCTSAKVAAASSSSSATAAAYDIPDLPLPDLPNDQPRLLFNPNLYRSTDKDVDKEPIYEELKEPPLSTNAASFQLSSDSSVYDMPKSTLSRSSSRASSVADNSIASGSSQTPSPVKVSNSGKILNRLDELETVDRSLPSTTHSRGIQRIDSEPEDEEDHSLTETIYANDVNCHQQEK